MKGTMQIEVPDDVLDEMVLRKLKEMSALYESKRETYPEWDEAADALKMVVQIFDVSANETNP